jgi:hypothetical protein
MREDKDNSAKWLIEHHGGAILRLSGIHGFTSWRTAHTQLTHPTQLPDGLLEVTFPEQAPTADLFLIEVATYPERRAEEQAARDAALVWLDRGVVPEVVTLVLHPKGQFRISGQWQLSSRRGLTRLACNWTVVELWTLSAEELLALNDVGVIPWVPLARTELPPEELLRQCRQRIDQQAKPEELQNLLAVTQVMTSVRYNELALLSILGGNTMGWFLETPLMQKVLSERIRDELQGAIVDVLRDKFAEVPEELAVKVRAIQDVQQLRQLISVAARCSDLDAFRAQLPNPSP